MLSQIERGEANPTFAVVWGLTQALKIDFSDLVGSANSTTADQIEVTSQAHTPEIRSLDGRCRLKILSPPRLASVTEWYEVEIDPGGILESDPHATGAFEHFTAFVGTFEITSAESSVRLACGETARYAADVSHRIENIGEELARGILILLYR